jgi:hypothetical protein
MAGYPLSLLKRTIVITTLVSAWGSVPTMVAAAEKAEIKANHSPKQPKSGEAVTVSVSLRRPVKANDFVLQYQVVEPGQYIALEDAEYTKNWT